MIKTGCWPSCKQFEHQNEWHWQIKTHWAGGWLETSCPLRRIPVNKCRRTQREKLRWVPPKRGNNNSSKNHHWMLKLLGKSFPERRYSHRFRVSIYGVLTNYKRKMCLYHGETWRSPLDQVVHFGLSIHKMTWPLVPCNWTQERRECHICGTLAKKV